MAQHHAHNVSHFTGEDAFLLDDITRLYNQVEAVSHVNLNFAKGQTSVLIGSSGSGKSTLLRLMIGLEWPDSGHIWYEGQKLGDDNIYALRQRIGYVIQEGGLFPHLTVSGNLALLPRYLGWRKTDIDARILELIELTHLEPALLPHFPAELSGGQRQRVALMRALMLDPPTLLLDEPLGALDPLVRYHLQDELKQIFAQLNKTVILVTHDMAEAAFFSNRLILMRHGKVLQQGSLADFRQHPTDSFVEEFLASHRPLPGDPS